MYGKKVFVIIKTIALFMCVVFLSSCKNTQGNSDLGIDQFQVDFSAGTGGKITASFEGGQETNKSPLTVEKDKILTFKAKADSGYEIGKWSITGGTFEANTGTEENETAKVKVNAKVEVKVKFQPTVELPELKSFTVNGVTFNMRIIKAVDANLGSNSKDDNKEHTIKLSEYCIGETEVTQGLWQAVMGNNPSYFSDNPALGEEQSMRPVENVSWFDCIAFCNELTKKLNNGSDSKCVYFSDPGGSNPYTKEDAKSNNPCYAPSFALGGFRLPTEAEWEWAAKGGKSYKYCGTDNADNLVEYAWYGLNSLNQTHEVKKKKMNGYGLYDMNGNVWEWCWDWYGPIPSNTRPNYKGANFGTHRILRGGCWMTRDATDAEVANRDYGYPYTNDGKDAGFRLVCK